MFKPNAPQCVPMGAIPGESKFCVFTDDYPTSNPVNSSCFNFTVTSQLGRSGIDDWNSSEWFKDGSDIRSAEFGLIGNYPNPFNTTTTIFFYLDKQEI